MKQLATLLILVVSLSFTPPVLSVEQHTVDKQTAAMKAMEKFPGRVISVNPEHRRNIPVHRVKILDDRGGVHTVIVHGQTGEILTAH